MATRNYQNWPNNSATPNYIAVAELLERSRPHVVTDIACNKKSINRKMSRSVNLRRYINPALDTTTLVEGVTPATRSVSSVDYTGTLEQYGIVFETTDVNEDFNPWDEARVAAELGKDYIQSLKERIRWNAMKAGTNVVYNASSVTATNQVNGPVALGRLQVAIRQLRAAKGNRFSSVVAGGSGEGTSPLEASFYAFGHSDLEADLRTLPGFKTVSEYPGGRGVNEFEFGSVQNIRFFTTAELNPTAGAGASVGSLNLKSTSGNVDVYPIVIVAKNALTSIALGGSGRNGSGNVEMFLHNKADKSDLLNQRRYWGAKFYDLCMRTAEEWLVRLEVGCTNNYT